jgi:hypothetical protein
VGKLFSETIRRGWTESLGSEESASSRALRRARRLEIQAIVRLEDWMSCGLPFRFRVSVGGYAAEQEAVVKVRRER